MSHDPRRSDLCKGWFTSQESTGLTWVANVRAGERLMDGRQSKADDWMGRDIVRVSVESKRSRKKEEIQASVGC